jgi:hypothetical protein
MIMVVDPGVQAVYGKKPEDSNKRKKYLMRPRAASPRLAFLFSPVG